MQRLLPVPKWHRAYVRANSVSLSVSVGIFLGGMINLAAPEIVAESAPTLVLPEWVLLAFNLVWLIGGGLATLGILRGWRRVEVPGMALIAGGLGAYYITAFSLRQTTALTAIFIALLALGCASRAVYLVQYGYSGEREP